MRQVLLQNAGSIGATTYANPDAVPDGVLAAFSEAGVGLALNSAISGKFFLVEGRASGTAPKSTPLLDWAAIGSAKVYKQTYLAPLVQRTSVTSVPAGPTGGDNYTVKITDRTQGSEPYNRKSAEVAVPASQAAGVTIAALVAAFNAIATTPPSNGARRQGRTVRFGCNQIFNTGTIVITTGTLTVTITDPGSGKTVVYNEAFATSAAVTAGNFVTNQAATVLADFGITVTNPSGAELEFAGSYGNGAFTVTIGGDATEGTTTTTAPTTLLIDALDFGTYFDVALEGTIESATVTTTQAMREGTGSGAQVQAEEVATKGLYSEIYQNNNILGAPEAQDVTASLAENYDLYVVRAPADIDPVINKSAEFEDIAVGLSTNVTGDLDTFFGV